tara:strand:- start:30 stop:371 length:342 start_codon:yes stop_codon:yes gene_type:complete
MKTSPALPDTSKKTSGTKAFRSSIPISNTTESAIRRMKNGASLQGSLSPRERKRKTYKKRYYLATRLRGKYKVDLASLTIYTPYHSVNDIPEPDRYYVRQAIKSGFQHQLSLF